MAKPFSNTELVTIAVYLLGGDSNFVDIEDIALKANELAPGRFTWKKYPEQISKWNVGKRLADARNPKKGGYLLGSYKDGWMLTQNGLKFCKKRVRDLEGTDISRPPLNKQEMAWRSREKVRMLATMAFEKAISNTDMVSAQEAEAFFRIDDYVTGEARQRKIARAINAFGDDSKLGEVIRSLAKKVRKK